MAKVIGGMSLPNIPWENKPEGNTDVVWRYSKNPIITRKDAFEANSIFNSAVVPYGDEFRGVFRIDGYDLLPLLRAGKSKDGIKWEIEEKALEWTDRNPDIGYEYGYDPRVVKLEDKYFITWCNGVPSGFTIGMGYTEDFESFHQMNNPFLTYNRNGVLFPRKINGKYAMLSRPTNPGSGSGLGSIWYSESPDLESRIEDNPWLKYEIPSKEELLEGATNLEKHDCKIDVILTHEPSSTIKSFLTLGESDSVRVTTLNAYFDELSKCSEFSRWFFGSLHLDKYISNTYIGVHKGIVNAHTGERVKF